MGDIDGVGKTPSVPLQRAATTGPVKAEASVSMGTDGLALSGKKAANAGPDPLLQKLSGKILVDGAITAGGVLTGVAGVVAAIALTPFVGIPLAVVGVGVGVWGFFKMRGDQDKYFKARDVARAEGRL